MTEHEKILDKIRKLKALANPDQNTSDNEIASALEIARKLMLEHGINESETTINIPNEELGGGTCFDLGTKNKQAWWISLAGAVGEYLDCKFFLRQSRINGISLVFYGPKDQAESAAYIFESVYKQVWNLSTAYKPSSCLFYGDRGYSKVAHREYREGLSNGLYERCKRIKEEEQRSAQASQITALAIRSEDIADNWLSKNIGKLKNANYRPNRTATGDQHYAKGFKDSDNLELNKAPAALRA